MIKLIIKALKRFAWFRKLNAKWTYELLAKRIPGSDWQFMNYGYAPGVTDKKIKIRNTGNVQLYPLQMYHYLAVKTRIEGIQLLEIGCGRGGGAKYIAATMKPACYTGMDIAQSAVDLANQLHKLPNLNFIQGSAEAIPLPDDSIDVVINVESCHAYGSVVRFLKEVKRVLRPGGYLMLVDFRSENKMNDFQAQMRDAGMDLIEEEDISQNVIRSIEIENETKWTRIRTLIPPKWHKLFAEFAGVVGSRFHQTLKDGTRDYYRFVMRKPSI